MLSINQSFVTYILGTRFGYRGKNLESELHFRGIKFLNIWGFDYRSTSTDVIKRRVLVKESRHLIGRNLSLGEICCALGHQEIYKKFLATSEPWALVLEDDARLMTDFNPNEIINQIKIDDSAIIQLYGIELVLNQQRIRSDVLIKEVSEVSADIALLRIIPELTHAYFINRSAAQHLVNACANGIHSTADWPILGLRNIKFYSTLKSIFQTTDAGSIIEAGRDDLSGNTERPDGSFWKIMKSLLFINSIKGRTYGLSFFAQQSYNFKQFLPFLFRRYRCVRPYRYLRKD